MIYAVPFLIAGMASSLRAAGVLMTCQKMHDAHWRRPNLANIRAGVSMDGIGCMLGALGGAPGLSAAPTLVGMQKITGASSRYIAYAIAGWLLLFACLPKIAMVLLMLPLPVVGAALTFNGASMLVGGIQIITSRPLTMRTTLVVGLSLLFTLSKAVYPQFYASLPAWTQAFTDSELTIAVLSCVFLNLILMIGDRQISSIVIALQKEASDDELNQFLQQQMKVWQINKEDFARIKSCLMEFLHILQTGGYLSEASLTTKVITNAL